MAAGVWLGRIIRRIGCGDYVGASDRGSRSVGVLLRKNREAQGQNRQTSEYLFVHSFRQRWLVYGGVHGLYSFLSLLFGADANSLLNVGNEDLSVADLSRFGGLYDDTDGRLGLPIGHDQLQLDFRQEVHRVFAAAIDFGVALLPAEPF